MSGREVRFDVGLQPERTLLAWRRTALAFVVAVTVAISIRYPAEVGGVAAAIVGIVAVALIVIAYAGASVYYGRVHRALVAGAPASKPGGAAMALLFAAALMLAIVGLGAVLGLGLGLGLGWRFP